MVLPIYGLETLFVSLGSQCDTAVMLRENHLRFAAFPFDWILTRDHEGFLLILDTDFCFFVDESSLYRIPDYPQILDNAIYKIQFRHDWPFEDMSVNESRYQQQIAHMKDKYERRIARFRDLRNFEGKVFFIRTAGVESIDEKKAKQILSSLTSYFPLLDFTLVIVNYREEHIPQFDDEEILEFKIGKSHQNEDYSDLLGRICEIDNFNKSLNF